MNQQIAIRDVEPTGAGAAVMLSEAPPPPWSARWNEYVAWAKGGPAPEGVPAEAGFSQAIVNSSFALAGDAIQITIGPGAAYADLQAFIDDSIAYANGA